MNADVIAFTESELRTLNAVARRVERVSRGYVEYDDVRSTLLMWMWTKRDTIERWRDEGKPSSYLNGALYKQGLSFVDAERRSRTGASKEDLAYYTRAILREVLPDVWDYESWLPSVDPSLTKAPSRPSEGNTRLAVLSDVSAAVWALPEADRAILQDVFRDGGIAWDVLAALWDTSETGARKRVDRVLDKLIDRLGGPPPWWESGRRDVRSNARAQAETE